MIDFYDLTRVLEAGSTYVQIAWLVWVCMFDRRSTVNSWLLSDARTPVWFSCRRLSGQGVVLKRPQMENLARQKSKFWTKTLVILCSLWKSKSNFLSTSFGDKKHPERRVDCLCFDFENLLRLFQQREKCKNNVNVCYCRQNHCRQNQHDCRQIYHGFFEMLSWPHRTSAKIINTCFWLLETCTKCSYFTEENIRPGTQRLAFEVKYEYIVRRSTNIPWACGLHLGKTTGAWCVVPCSSAQQR